MNTGKRDGSIGNFGPSAQVQFLPIAEVSKTNTSTELLHQDVAQFEQKRDTEESDSSEGDNYDSEQDDENEDDEESEDGSENGENQVQTRVKVKKNLNLGVMMMNMSQNQLIYLPTMLE